MSAILFFDAAPGGHHGEFLENVIYGIPESVASVAVILAHPDLESRLEAAKLECSSPISLDYLSGAQLDLLNATKSLFQRGRLELDIAESACAKWGAQRIFLMHMNIHQIALSYCFRQPGMSVRGVLLNPYTPMRRAHTLKQKFSAFITGVRKRMQLYVMLLNPRVDKVFVLNDARLAEDLNFGLFKRRPFASVVDPIPAIVSHSDTEVRDPDEQSERFTFLLFGSLDPRKGALETLRAIEHLSEDELAKIRIRIVGRLRGVDDYRTSLMAAVASLRQRSPMVCVELEDRYVDIEEMQLEFTQADCILIPYVDFYGSSGVLGHACRFFKPVITCDTGLIGELARQLEIGHATNPCDPIGYSLVIRRMLTGDLVYNKASALCYQECANYKVFSEALVNAW
ncbi:MAG: hypothetical protein NWS71_11180 [Opitutales bacterium]|jgi:glycosyltransferase involved in cell wall biosynthesis|nr:hypothetical protein [Opitutales bacterium]